MPNLVDTQVAHLKEICDKCETAPGTYEKLYNKYFKYVNDIVLKEVVDIISTMGAEVKIFEETLHNSHNVMGKFINTQVRPLMIFPNKDQLNIRIYPNIVLDANTDFNSITSLYITDIQNVLGNFIQEYEADMASDTRKEKWANTTRINKRLKEFLDMPTARALTRYGNYESKYKPDQIRDFAAKIDTARKPMELIYADKPEDFLIMYGSGPSSCMSAQYNSNWKFLVDAGQCPPSFYAYFPYTRGAYLMKAGKVIARTVLWADLKSIKGDYQDMGYPKYNKNICERWYHGTIYTNEHDIFDKVLRSNGITKLSSLFSPPEGTTFKVPGISFNQEVAKRGDTFDASKPDYAMPFPFFDNLEGKNGTDGYYGKGFFASWDKEIKEFSLVYQKAVMKGSTAAINGRGGYLRASDYVNLACDHCGGNMSTKTAISTEDGFSFCSVTCYTTNGYVKAIQGNGQILLTKNSEGLIKADDGNIFTTLAAAVDNGYLLKSRDFGCIAEDTEVVTSIGYAIRGRDGTHYRHPDRAFMFNDIIPIEIVSQQKVVEFNLEEDLAFGAAA